MKKKKLCRFLVGLQRQTEQRIGNAKLLVPECTSDLARGHKGLEGFASKRNQIWESKLPRNGFESLAILIQQVD